MAIAPGDTRHVALYLRRFQTISEFLLRGSDSARGAGRTPDVRVAAKICGPKGSTRYHGEGEVANRDGRRFTFGLTPDSEALGTHPSDIEGVWDGENQLELKLRLYTQGSDGARGEASRSARPGGSDNTGVIRFELHRITEPAYDAAC